VAYNLAFIQSKLTPANLYLVIVLVITLVVYWPGLSGPLLLDDIPNLHHLQNYGEGHINWKEVFYLSPHGLTRPISMLSFIGNWVISGENIWYLKFTNLMIHLLCGLLIYRLSWLLLQYDIIEKEKRARNIALWITALWLLSPLLLSTVLYVIQRMTLLSALFTLSGLVFYVTGRINLGENRNSGIYLIVVSFVFFWPMATLSKQNGILLPLLILILEFFSFIKT
jgi:protein O-mannosyl-transferase